MNEAILGMRQFADGVDRIVILDAEGRQYFNDDRERRVYGEWLDPKKFEPDHCVLVSSGDPSASTVPAADSRRNEKVSRELADFRWIESQKAGFDIGLEYAIHAWVWQHWTGYFRSKLLEHLVGNKFWSELDKGDFGLLRHAFKDDLLLIDRIIDRLKVQHENLDILSWAQEWGIPSENVLRILEALDINSRRLSPRFDT